MTGAARVDRRPVRGDRVPPGEGPPGVGPGRIVRRAVARPDVRPAVMVERPGMAAATDPAGRVVDGRVSGHGMVVSGVAPGVARAPVARALIVVDTRGTAETATGVPTDGESRSPLGVIFPAGCVTRSICRPPRLVASRP